jgi:mannose-6-phosphate isomerase
MDHPLYPLFFDPIYQYRLWGGRRLESFLSKPLPEGSVGEAWILSDRDDHPSRVRCGALAGKTLSELLPTWQKEIMGDLAGRFDRFPLLLKFLDARQTLSVQVHPSDSQTDLLPPGERGKTEAWVVLEAGPKSIIYAGLKPGTTPVTLRTALADDTVANLLDGFNPKDGDAVFIPAGAVHALGGDTVVFEVQENSDVTFRLYDWGHVEAKTGKPRELHIEQAMACIDFGRDAGGPVRVHIEAESPVRRERLFDCDHFSTTRTTGSKPFPVGALDSPRILVCTDGAGSILHQSRAYETRKGDVALLPASLGVCDFNPKDEVTLLEIAIPG